MQSPKMQVQASGDAGWDIVYFWLACAACTVLLAIGKRRSIVFWTIFGLLAGPLATLWIFYLRKREKVKPYVAPSFDADGITLGTGNVVKGLRAEIEIRTDGISIRREEGGRNLLLHGLKGEKRIPYRSITAIQLKLPGELTSGYIQFSVLGGIESGRGIFDATTDENSVLFVGDQGARMVALRDYVERQLSAPTKSAGGSVADEIAKLAALKDQGLLTESEFSSQKANLLK